MAPNAIRGEAEATIGDVTITMAATMDGLARLSEATGRPTLQELYQRLMGGELSTVVTAVRLFATGGTQDGAKLSARVAGDRAVERLNLTSVIALQPAFLQLLSALMGDPDSGTKPEGNG